MDDFKNAVRGAVTGLAIIAAVFIIAGTMMAWLFYAVPWVYHHAPRLGSTDDLVPFVMAIATAFAGPAMVVGAITGATRWPS